MLIDDSMISFLMLLSFFDRNVEFLSQVFRIPAFLVLFCFHKLFNACNVLTRRGKPTLLPHFRHHEVNS